MHFRRAGIFFIPLFIAALVLTFAITVVSPSTSVDAQTAAVRIMPLGDSITTHIPPYNSYRRPLWHMLNNAGYSVDFVGSRRVDDSNRLPPNPDFDLEYEGHPGWRVDNILGSIRPWADAYDPDIVLVHLGTNDLIQGQSVDSTISELGQLIDTLRASNPNVTILMAQIIPFNRTNGQNVPTLNSRIATLVAARNTSQSRVILVDQYSGFNTSTDTFDGTHPNVAGEQKLANRWYAALQNVLSASGTQPTPTRTPTQVATSVPAPTQQPTTVPGGSGTGLTGQYYNNIDLTSLALTRTDPTINFYWNTGSPASAISPDTYSARWTGQVSPRYSQTYTFYTTSDDGVRLRVNGQLLIDNWTNHGPTENSGTISLQAGQRYNIQLDYYENDVGATLTLSWSSQSQPKQIIPQSQLFPATGASNTPVPVPTVVSTSIPPTTGLYRAINLAGSAVTIDGQAWEAQASAANFTATTNGSHCWTNPTLIPTTDVNRYNMLRCSVYGGQMNLTMSAVPSGSYDVYLYIWEDNASVTTSISLEGALVQSNYQTGSAGTWRRLGPWRVQVSDSTIVLTTSGSWVNLSGLEVRYAS